MFLASLLALQLLPPSLDDGPMFHTAQQLYEYCQQPRTSWHFGYCRGFIIGTADTLELMAAPTKVRMVCKPEGLTISQLTDLVIHYLENHPTKRHNAAADQVFGALLDAYRCPGL